MFKKRKSGAKKLRKKDDGSTVAQLDGSSDRTGNDPSSNGASDLTNLGLVHDSNRRRKRRTNAFSSSTSDMKPRMPKVSVADVRFVASLASELFPAEGTNVDSRGRTRDEADGAGEHLQGFEEGIGVENESEIDDFDDTEEALARRKLDSRRTRETAWDPTDMEDVGETKPLDCVSVLGKLNRDISVRQHQIRLRKVELGQHETNLSGLPSQMKQIEAKLPDALQRQEFFKSLKSDINEQIRLIGSKLGMLKDAIFVQESLWEDELLLWQASEDVESQRINLNGRKNSLHAASQMIMKGLGGEIFPSCASLRKLFGTWKAQYTKEYEDAHGDLSLSDLVSPFALVDMLLWDPLEYDCSYVFEERSWFTEFSLEAAVMPKIVSKTILPSLVRQIEFIEKRETVLRKDGVRGQAYIQNLQAASLLVDRYCKDHPDLVDNFSQHKLQYLSKFFLA